MTRDDGAPVSDRKPTSSPVSWFHGNYVHGRRVDVLAKHFSDLIAPQVRVLDIGCGDGLLASTIAQRRSDLAIQGTDILVREQTAIPVEPFDGKTLPYDADDFDTVIMVDVLHHTDSPQTLLAEATRVASKQIVIKDHYLRGIAAQQTLALMDRVGNARHGVDIPCNYLTETQWNGLFDSCGLRLEECRERLGLYPPPLSWLFERRLHFIASLQVNRS